jgi:uncharacterized membrane protein (UPF0182 family)
MRSRGLTALVVLGLILLFAVPSIAVYYTDFLWFQELGYSAVFLRSINVQATVFLSAFVLAFAFLYINLWFAQRSLKMPRVVLGQTVDGRPVALERGGMSRLAVIVSVVIGFMLAVSSAANWMTWVSFFNSVPFGAADPLLGRDVSFYVFRLPVYDAIRQQALLVTAVAIVGSGLSYLLAGNVVLEPRYGIAFWPKMRLAPAARRHMAWLVALALGLMAWGAWLELFRTLITPGGGETSAVVFGASYTDVTATMPVLRIKLVILSLGSVLSIWQSVSSQTWPAPAAIALYIIVTVGGGLYGSIVQQFIVTPNEQEKELPYIVHNINATRAAYSLDRVEERQLTGDASLAAKDIIANAETIENVRLWDHQPLLQTFAQNQSIRTYYDFVSVDNDRYRINGKSRQVMLSAREMNTDSLQNPSWVNNRLSFTHGYGLTLGPVNQVTTAGLPVLFVRDIPPVSTVKDLPISEASIYFGEKSSNYVLVKTKTEEFHYPRGQDNVTSTYQGTGGIPVGGFFRRLLLAARFGSLEILVSKQLTKDSRILFHRQVIERVKEIAPFFEYDQDPYLVIDGGRLFWMLDAYTTTANYPYAARVTGRVLPRLNYIRNSVKIVIDAYHGTTTFYLAEPKDPIALTIAKVFPGLLKPLDQMPGGLRQHVRYPEDIFALQASVFSTYHMTNPTVFYNKEDQWQLPVVESGDRTQAGTPLGMQPYYTIMKLPGEKKAEFIQMLPFTPRLKDNLSAWMVARSDGDQYGRMLVYQFPKQKTVYGPSQINALINQDQVISPQITLWSQQGSDVKFGTLMVIPIEESLLYVRPLYLRASTGRIPELKRVIVAYQSAADSKIVMAETLTLALSQIFGRTIVSALEPDQLETGGGSEVLPTPGPATPGAPPVTTPIPADATFAQLAAEASDTLDRAEKAQRAGDWATYGEEQKKLRDLLTRMKGIKK